eukprot:351162-Chlamydomonas_euryale.AAC.1
MSAAAPAATRAHAQRQGVCRLGVGRGCKVRVCEGGGQCACDMEARRKSGCEVDVYEVGVVLGRGQGGCRVAAKQAGESQHRCVTKREGHGAVLQVAERGQRVGGTRFRKQPPAGVDGGGVASQRRGAAWYGHGKWAWTGEVWQVSDVTRHGMGMADGCGKGRCGSWSPWPPGKGLPRPRQPLHGPLTARQGRPAEQSALGHAGPRTSRRHHTHSTTHHNKAQDACYGNASTS